MNTGEGDGFLSRWSRRKARVQEGQPAQEPPHAAVPVPDTLPSATPAAMPAPAAAAPAPTLDDVSGLEPGSDFRPFVARDVDPQVRNAALKKLFTDPQFNVMDGLDTYIDDYGKPDPIPASMLRKMVQAHALGLFDDEKVEGAPAQAVVASSGADPDGAPSTSAAQSAPDVSSSEPPDDDDVAVRLQPDDAAGPAGPAGGAGEDARRQR
jgi:hypothetical protein